MAEKEADRSEVIASRRCTPPLVVYCTADDLARKRNGEPPMPRSSVCDMVAAELEAASSAGRVVVICPAKQTAHRLPRVHPSRTSDYGCHPWSTLACHLPPTASLKRDGEVGRGEPAVRICKRVQRRSHGFHVPSARTRSAGDLPIRQRVRKDAERHGDFDSKAHRPHQVPPWSMLMVESRVIVLD